MEATARVDPVEVARVLSWSVEALEALEARAVLEAPEAQVAPAAPGKLSCTAAPEVPAAREAPAVRDPVVAALVAAFLARHVDRADRVGPADQAAASRAMDLLDRDTSFTPHR